LGFSSALRPAVRRQRNDCDAKANKFSHLIPNAKLLAASLSR
jgi:hypothetical protein